jgi:3-dehydroquinate synthase
MSTIRIASSSGSYDVLCFRGAIGRVRAVAERRNKLAPIVFISSPRVWSHWGKKLSGKSRAAASAGVLFDDSEAAKRLSTVEEIARALIALGADRHATLVAVGGGVVGDVAGFVAATYLRGVSIVHVPTTLVAQVDSSIGGKTGVNLPEGKNLVGAFYPPKLVIADPDVLSTLPHREFRAGLYEVIKYGVIADAALFKFLERHMLGLLRRDRSALEYVIPRCIRIKAQVVGKDERESGVRQILNFGHTMGHALETATSYRRFLHGEAIGWGMLAATLIGVAMNRVPEIDAGRIIRLIARVGPLPKLDGINAAALRSIIAGDKKSQRGRVGWVLSRRIGKADWGHEVPWPLVTRVLRELPGIAAKGSN